MTDATVAIDDLPDTAAADGQTPRSRKRPVCAITGKTLKRRDATHLAAIRPSLADFIRSEHPELTPDDWISLDVVGDYRGRYITAMLGHERGELSELEKEVVESLRTHETIAENVEEDIDEQRTFGERLADRVASFGGSWTFLIAFGLFLAGWMALNGVLGDEQRFDPFPYILLNLALSCVAAVQAPIIMMSQKRTEAKDRLRSESDYRVNLKAELEIRHLHEKVDHLLNRQWERLAELQQIQIEMMREVAARVPLKLPRPKPKKKSKPKKPKPDATPSSPKDDTPPPA